MSKRDAGSLRPGVPLPFAPQCTRSLLPTPYTQTHPRCKQHQRVWPSHVVARQCQRSPPFLLFVSVALPLLPPPPATPPFMPALSQVLHGAARTREEWPPAGRQGGGRCDLSSSIRAPIHPSFVTDDASPFPLGGKLKHDRAHSVTDSMRPPPSQHLVTRPCFLFCTPCAQRV
jgi:hypothetical protein